VYYERIAGLTGRAIPLFDDFRSRDNFFSGIAWIGPAKARSVYLEGGLGNGSSAKLLIIE